MEKQQTIELLESEIEVQKSILDEVNITLILAIWQLISNYFLLPDHEKGIIHLKSLGVTEINAFLVIAPQTRLLILVIL